MQVELHDGAEALRNDLSSIARRAPPLPPHTMLGAGRKPGSSLQNFCPTDVFIARPLSQHCIGGEGGGCGPHEKLQPGIPQILLAKYCPRSVVQAPPSARRPSAVLASTTGSWLARAAHSVQLTRHALRFLPSLLLLSPFRAFRPPCAPPGAKNEGRRARSTHRNRRRLPGAHRHPGGVEGMLPPPPVAMCGRRPPAPSSGAPHGRRPDSTAPHLSLIRTFAACRGVSFNSLTRSARPRLQRSSPSTAFSRTRPSTSAGRPIFRAFSTFARRAWARLGQHIACQHLGRPPGPEL